MKRCGSADGSVLSRQKPRADNSNKAKGLDEMKGIVLAYLEKNGWLYETDNKFAQDGVFVVKGSIGGVGELSLTCQFLLLIREDSVDSYAISGISASEQRKQSISEFITRANYGLRYGNFEMDWQDGEIRYHLIRSRPSIIYDINATIEQLLCLPASMLGRFESGLADVVMGRESPERAVEMCETK